MSLLRSLLFAPSAFGSIDATAASGADAIILDPGYASSWGASWRDRPDRPRCFFRVGAGDAGHLDAALAARPDGVVLAGAEHGADVMRVSAMIAAYEAMAGIDDGATAIIALVTTPGGLLALDTFRGASRRLRGLGFDASGLAAAMGAHPRDEDGGLTEPLRVARTLVLAAAAAAGVPALDTACGPATDLSRLATEAAAARRDGFAGKFATTPAEVSVINQAFGA